MSNQKEGLVTFLDEVDWTPKNRIGTTEPFFKSEIKDLKSPPQDTFAIDHGNMTKLLIFDNSQLFIINFNSRRENPIRDMMVVNDQTKSDDKDELPLVHLRGDKKRYLIKGG